MADGPVRVLVTAAAGKIGYALVLLVAKGKMLGPDQPVILHLLEIPSAAVSLDQVKKELEDAALPLLKGVIATTDLVEAWTGVNIAIMLHGFPGEEGLEKLYAMSKNVSIFKSEGSALEKHAAADCKVVVVGDLANTNAFILKNFAPSIPEKNITCLTRLDQNRSLGQLAKYLNIQVSDAKNLIAWGSSSSSQYLDFDHATVQTLDGDRTVRELVADPPIPWLTERFLSTVVQHAAAMMRAGNTISALPSASAVCDHIRDWVLGTPPGTWVSMGVYSDGSYNVPTGLFYSFPVTCANGEWEIVQGLPIDELSRSKLELTADELSVEKAYCMLMLASLRDA